MIIRKIGKSGGSFIIPLPMSLLAALKLHRGDYVSLSLSQDLKSIKISNIHRVSVKEENKSNGKAFKN